MEGEIPDVFTETHPKARKAHKCCECRREIEPGEVYQLAKGHWPDGIGWDSFKTCNACAVLRDEIREDGDGVPAFGYLEEWAGESGRAFPPEKINQAGPAGTIAGDSGT